MGQPSPVSTEPASGSSSKSNILKLAPVLIFAAMAGIFALALKKGDPSKLPSTLIGKTVPPLDYPAVQGLVRGEKPVPGFTHKDLASGRVSIVNFWASWCVACVSEHPNLVALREKGIPIYGVDYKDSATNARRFLGRLGNPYRAVGTDRNGRKAIEWGVYGMPESFIVNGRGQIIYKHVGPISKEDIETTIMPLIERERKKAGKSS